MLTLDLAFSLATLVLMIWGQDIILLTTGRRSVHELTVCSDVLAELLESESNTRITVSLE